MNPLELVLALECIESWIAHNYPERLPFLRAGASSGTISRIEAKFGRALPDDIRQLYAAHDGQPAGTPALYLNQRWLPLDLVFVAWEDLCLRYSDKAQVALGDNRQCPGNEFWSVNWLPIFSSPRGDHYCLDLSSEVPGRCGQIIWFLYDEPDRPVVARSISELLSRIATGLTTGRWKLDDGYDGLSD